jgi:signal transduction histidine kinase
VTRILVVDDETALVELVRGYLEREQYEVLTAADGRTALDLARSAHPDLVVLDIMLPGLDGIEVCRQLRQFSDAYVIMLTARAEELDKILGLTVGADDYLTKPFSPRELVARVKALLRRPRQTGAASSTGPPDDTPAPQRWNDLVIDEAQLLLILQTHPATLSTAEASQRILGAFLGTLLLALAVAAVVATVTSLATSLFVARRVTFPLREMTQASERISAGHYAERIEVAPVHASDELGQLAASINELAVALEQTERRRLEVIGDVAHELRTPIATLEGYLEGLLDGVIEPTPQTLALLHTEAGRLRRLVDDLQELSRAEARQIPLSPQPVAPQQLVQAALEPLTGQFAEKGLDLVVQVPQELPRVMADPARAGQILTNLLVNALRYTPAPGRVEVAVGRKGASVAFRVSDSGVGLSPEQLAHIFERFYRVDKSRSRALGGSGIGLTIAESLAQAMGGDVRAESAGPGMGSCFTLTLPLAQE